MFAIVVLVILCVSSITHIIYNSVNYNGTPIRLAAIIWHSIMTILSFIAVLTLV